MQLMNKLEAKSYLIKLGDANNNNCFIFSEDNLKTYYNALRNLNIFNMNVVSFMLRIQKKDKDNVRYSSYSVKNKQRLVAFNQDLKAYTQRIIFL